MTIGFTNSSASISTTEYSLPNDSTTLTPQTDDCILQVIVGLQNLAAGDTYAVKVYESDGTSQGLIATFLKSGVQAEPKFIIPSMIVGVGWDITVTKIAGTDRTISWSIRKVT